MFTQLAFAVTATHNKEIEEKKQNIAKLEKSRIDLLKEEENERYFIEEQRKAIESILKGKTNITDQELKEKLLKEAENEIIKIEKRREEIASKLKYIHFEEKK